MNQTALTKTIKARALELGFDKIGIARAEPVDSSIYREWLHRGFHGQMAYMARYLDKRFDPGQLVPGAQSVISVAMNYFQKTEPRQAKEGNISLYALGDDYHEILRQRMKELLSDIHSLESGCRGRVFVDTAPIQDKYWAVKAGVGWLGKHSNVITREFGSWVFLGELVITLGLDYDSPLPDYCGTCTRCLEACPTGAIVTPHLVDARKCISYWTIEVKGEQDIPPDIAEHMNSWIFGCDICQVVCPWNQKFSRETAEPRFKARPHTLHPLLKEIVNLSPDTFNHRYRKSAIKRTKLKGLVRNSRTVLKNSQK